MLKQITQFKKRCFENIKLRLKRVITTRNRPAQSDIFIISAAPQPHHPLLFSSLFLLSGSSA